MTGHWGWLVLGDSAVKNAKIPGISPPIKGPTAPVLLMKSQGQGYVPVLQCQGADIMNAYQFQE
jgi:hypothetical protein